MSGTHRPEVRLRPVTVDDLPILFEHQRDQVSVALAEVPPRDREDFMAHWAEVLADEAVVTRTVLADGAVAGHLSGFTRNGKREVGYWIDREHWGKGVASAALPQFLTIETTRPLFGGVAPGNPASRRVLEKCGFVVVGTEPDGFILLRLDDVATAREEGS